MAARFRGSPITPVEAVSDLDLVRDHLLRTKAPDGREIRLPPPAASTTFLEASGGELAFAPGYGENTDAVLAEIGLEPQEVNRLREEGVVS